MVEARMIIIFTKMYMFVSKFLISIIDMQYTNEEKINVGREMLFNVLCNEFCLSNILIEYELFSIKNLYESINDKKYTNNKIAIASKLFTFPNAFNIF